MPSNDPSRSNSRSRYDAELSTMLEGLRDLDLSNDLSGYSLHPCAHGAQCDIFTAKSNRHRGLEVAVKRLRVHIQEREDVSKKILRELRIWSSLKHPNILPLLGFEMHGGCPAFISQWMNKGSLRVYMRSDPDISSKIMYLSGEIASGLHHLHRQGIIHSDLKSDNVLISDEGTPLLADFGISRIMSSTGTATSITDGSRGSVRWMAIELLVPGIPDMVAGKHTMQTDVWAYGMVVYELLARNMPFFELPTDASVVVAIVVEGRRPDLTKLPGGDSLLSNICELCWQNSPLARPEMRNICGIISNSYGQINATQSYSTSNSAPLTPSGSSAAISVSPSTLPGIICKCRNPHDGHLITCYNCNRTFHAACHHIYLGNVNTSYFECWVCQQASASSTSNSSSPSFPGVSPDASGTMGGVSPSERRRPTDRVQGGYFRPHGDVSRNLNPSEISSGSGSTNGSRQGSRQLGPNNPSQYPSSSSPQVNYQQSPVQVLASSSPHSSSPGAGTGHRNASGLMNRSTSTTTHETNVPAGSRGGHISLSYHEARHSLQTTSPTKTRNLEPCGYCMEHRLKCDIDPPFHKGLCRKCYENNFANCPSYRNNASLPSPTTSLAKTRNLEPCGYCMEHRIKCDIDPPFHKGLCRKCHENNFTHCPSTRRNET